MVQIWISNLFLCHVFPNALEYRTCICRNPQLKTGSLPALDIFVPVGLGIPRNTIPSGRRTVCFWILQCHADIYRTWGCNNDLVQTEKLVRLLSDGNNDSAHL